MGVVKSVGALSWWSAKRDAPAPAVSEPTVEGSIERALALSNIVARSIMGWHTQRGDAQRRWRDAGGEAVWSSPPGNPECRQTLIASPYIADDHPKDDGKVISFVPSRFDEHWQMLEQRIALLGIEVHQDRQATRVSNANGAVEVAGCFRTTAAHSPKRTAVLYGLVRLVAEGVVDIEDIGDVDRHRIEALHQQRLLRDRWQAL